MAFKIVNPTLAKASGFWNEILHPRDWHGRFVSTNGQGAGDLVKYKANGSTKATALYHQAISDPTSVSKIVHGNGVSKYEFKATQYAPAQVLTVKQDGQVHAVHVNTGYLKPSGAISKDAVHTQANTPVYPGEVYHSGNGSQLVVHTDGSSTLTTSNGATHEYNPYATQVQVNKPMWQPSSGGNPGAPTSGSRADIVLHNEADGAVLTVHPDGSADAIDKNGVNSHQPAGTITATNVGMLKASGKWTSTEVPTEETPSKFDNGLSEPKTFYLTSKTAVYHHVVINPDGSGQFYKDDGSAGSTWAVGHYTADKIQERIDNGKWSTVDPEAPSKTPTKATSDLTPGDVIQGIGGHNYTVQEVKPYGDVSDIYLTDANGNDLTWFKKPNDKTYPVLPNESPKPHFITPKTTPVHEYELQDNGLLTHVGDVTPYKDGQLMPWNAGDIQTWINNGLMQPKSDTLTPAQQKALDQFKQGIWTLDELKANHGFTDQMLKDNGVNPAPSAPSKYQPGAHYIVSNGQEVVLQADGTAKWVGGPADGATVAGITPDGIKAKIAMDEWTLKPSTSVFHNEVYEKPTVINGVHLSQSDVAALHSGISDAGNSSIAGVADAAQSYGLHLAPDEQTKLADAVSTWSQLHEQSGSMSTHLAHLLDHPDEVPTAQQIASTVNPDSINLVAGKDLNPGDMLQLGPDPVEITKIDSEDGDGYMTVHVKMPDGYETHFYTQPDTTQEVIGHSVPDSTPSGSKSYSGSNEDLTWSHTSSNSTMTVHPDGSADVVMNGQEMNFPAESYGPSEIALLDHDIWKPTSQAASAAAGPPPIGHTNVTPYGINVGGHLFTHQDIQHLVNAQNISPYANWASFIGHASVSPVSDSNIDGVKQALINHKEDQDHFESTAVALLHVLGAKQDANEDWYLPSDHPSIGPNAIEIEDTGEEYEAGIDTPKTWLVNELGEKPYYQQINPDGSGQQFNSQGDPVGPAQEPGYWNHSDVNQFDQKYMAAANWDESFGTTPPSEPEPTPPQPEKTAIGAFEKDSQLHLDAAEVPNAGGAPDNTTGSPGKGMPGLEALPDELGVGPLPQSWAMVGSDNIDTANAIGAMYGGKPVAAVYNTPTKTVYSFTDHSNLVFSKASDGSISAKLTASADLPSQNIGSGALPKTMSQVRCNTAATAELRKQLYKGDVQIVQAIPVSNTETVLKLSNDQYLKIERRTNGIYSKIVSYSELGIESQAEAATGQEVKTDAQGVAAVMDLPFQVHNSASEGINWANKAFHDIKITGGPAQSVKAYTGNSWYGKINSYLGGKTANADSGTLNHIKNIEKAMEMSWTPDPVRICRGWNIEDILQDENGHQMLPEDAVGKTFKSKAFASCSVGNKAAFSGKSLQMDIYAPAGTHMVYAKTVSNYPGENEMLLDKNVNLYIAEVKKIGNSYYGGGQFWCKAYVIPDGADVDVIVPKGKVTQAAGTSSLVSEGEKPPLVSKPTEFAAAGGKKITVFADGSAVNSDGTYYKPGTVKEGTTKGTILLGGQTTGTPKTSGKASSMAGSTAPKPGTYKHSNGATLQVFPDGHAEYDGEAQGKGKKTYHVGLFKQEQITNSSSWTHQSGDPGKATAPEPAAPHVPTPDATPVTPKVTPAAIVNNPNPASAPDIKLKPSVPNTHSAWMQPDGSVQIVNDQSHGGVKLQQGDKVYQNGKAGKWMIVKPDGSAYLYSWNGNLEKKLTFQQKTNYGQKWNYITTHDPAATHTHLKSLEQPGAQHFTTTTGSTHYVINPDGSGYNLSNNGTWHEYSKGAVKADVYAGSDYYHEVTGSPLGGDLGGVASAPTTTNNLPGFINLQPGDQVWHPNSAGIPLQWIVQHPDGTKTGYYKDGPSDNPVQSNTFKTNPKWSIVHTEGSAPAAVPEVNPATGLSQSKTWEHKSTAALTTINPDGSGTYESKGGVTNDMPAGTYDAQDVQFMNQNTMYKEVSEA